LNTGLKVGLNDDLNEGLREDMSEGLTDCKISVIIPVLDEESNLSHLRSYLQSIIGQGHEVIIVDGGSSDNTLKISHQITQQVIVSKAGRALQMNNGAAVANGDVLLFLHADTLLPENALQFVLALFQQKDCTRETIWGHFDVRLSSNKYVYRIIEKLINLRSCLSSIATGDQAIFIEKNLFNRIHGYPEIALMEDIAISCQLKKISRAKCIKQKVVTSSRRWESNGVVKTVLLMWRLRLYYFFGRSPERLRQLYD